MNKVNIVYYSFTGNTLRMVKAFEKGLQEANVPFKSYSVVELKDDNEAFDCEILALASPANQTEEIEKNYFQPFMKRNAEKYFVDFDGDIKDKLSKNMIFEKDVYEFID